MAKKGISSINKWKQIVLNDINISKIKPGICNKNFERFRKFS